VTNDDRARTDGDCIGQKHYCQPRTLLFRMLSILWVFPSLGALFIIGSDFTRWFQVSSVLAGLRAVALEEWIALGVLLLHLAFVWLALRYRRHEALREVSAEAPESGHAFAEPIDQRENVS